MRRCSDEILLHRTGFRIVARGQSFGPFDYQWSLDLHGLELLYRGRKFGEICSPDSLFADLTEFQLPMSVCRVAVITLGVIVNGISTGDCMDQKVSNLLTALEQFGYSRFQLRASDEDGIGEDQSA
ncbi:MAG: hypothetical protein ABJZ55_19240 [Fuerstiella sp.]